MNAPTGPIEGKAIPSPPRGQRRPRGFIDHRLPYLVLVLLLATLIGLVVLPLIAVNVPSGEVGVVWRRFGGGTVLNRRSILNEGLHFMLPWNRLFLYDLRLQSITEDYNVISSDGVRMIASINIRFRLQRDSVPVLHQTLGPDYLDVLIRPAIGSITREVVAQYTAEEVYSTARQEIQEKIRSLTLEQAGRRTMHKEGEGTDTYAVPLQSLFILYDTLLYGLELPPSVVIAINRKVEQYYIVQEYGFRVEREKKESERKRIEAQGISEFQKIVSQGITPSYLRWRSIDATLQLSLSTNSKVVIVGSGKDGLPVILGGAPSEGSEGGNAPQRQGEDTPQRQGDASLLDSAPPEWPTLTMADIAEYLSHTAEADWSALPPGRGPAR
jgi:regulator of protease activity HflC (stomatin/prohibitin superfamily)